MSNAISVRVRQLDRRAERTADGFDPAPPAEARAEQLLRRGVGPTVTLFCEARTGEAWHRFDDEEFERLESALDRWLSLYAACYGVDLDGTYPVRTAAELLEETRDIGDVAAELTGVPDR